MLLALIMATQAGTREQKTELLTRLFAKRGARRRIRLTKIYAKYLIWRQRMCWMWGGGFRAACVEVMRLEFISAQDQISFDALIPN